MQATAARTVRHHLCGVWRSGAASTPSRRALGTHAHCHPAAPRSALAGSSGVHRLEARVAGASSPAAGSTLWQYRVNNCVERSAAAAVGGGRRATLSLPRMRASLRCTRTVGQASVRMAGGSNPLLAYALQAPRKGCPSTMVSKMWQKRPRGNGLAAATARRAQSTAALPFCLSTASRLMVSFHPVVLTPTARIAGRARWGWARALARALRRGEPAAMMVHVMRTRPLAFAGAISFAKMAGVDYCVQSAVGGSGEGGSVDWRRVFGFGAFGLLYCGAWQHLFYTHLLPYAFPGARAFAALPLGAKLRDARGLRQMLGQVGVDQLVNQPLVYFPLFYVLKATVAEGASVRAGLTQWYANIAEDMAICVKIWVPVQMVNFTISPLWFRTPLVMGVGLVWTGMLSYTRGADQDEQP